MRHPTALNAEDQQLQEHTFRNKWKQASQEYEQPIMEARSSNQPWSKTEAMSRAWRVITDTFVSSVLTQTTYMQYKGKAPKFFQTTVGGFTKPGKIGEVVVQVRQLQNWASKIAGFRDEWKQEERANHRRRRIAMRSRRCGRARWETLMAKGHFWLAESMKESGTEMNEQTMEKLVTAAWKETEKEHKNYVADRIKRRNQKLNEAYSSNGKYLLAPVDQTGLPDSDCDKEESRWIHSDELPRGSPNTG